MRIVEAKTVEDYLDRYYKRDRYTGRGKENEAALLESYQEQFKNEGYVCTSHHDNVVGEFIAWPFYPGHKEVDNDSITNNKE